MAESDETVDERAHRTAAAAPRLHERGREPNVVPDDRFVIGEELGRGGMGRVVAATDTMLDREVAIKQALDDDFGGERFEREAKITAQLEHPSIVPIHDAGRDEHGRPYYIMRRIAGEPLADRIASAHDVKARLALVPRFVVAVDAAGFAHAHGIIHRDIKPWNILLGAHGETLLIDWGLARRLDEPADGDASGTPGFMAPEQARGDRVDARADVYALGATLRAVLAGSVEGSTVTDPAIPRELVTIVGKALADDPADRYPDAAALAVDLHAFLDGRLVAAHHYSALARVVRFVRRHRLAVAMTLVALGTIATIGVVAVRRVIAERDRAADRSDVLLLDRASGLVARDPTRAVALLATLPPETHYAARARDIAAIAALHGIEHGALAHDGMIVALELAPDGHRLLSAGGFDGTIQIRELTTGAARTLVPRGPSIEHAVWTDGGRSITYLAQGTGLRIIDVASGTARVLDPDVVADVMSAPGDGARVRLHDTKRSQVIEVLTSGAPATVLARDAATVVFDGERFAIAGTGTVRLVDEHGERVVGHYEGQDPGTLAISEDGSRVAAGFRATAIEWDAATATTRGTWPGIAFNVLYAGSRLFGSNAHRNGQLDALISNGTFETLSADWSLLWSTRIAAGLALVDTSGDLAVLGEGGNHELRFDHPGSRVLAGRTDSPYLAVGSNDGSIRWWDLRAFMPESHVFQIGQLCAIDAHTIYLRAPSQVLLAPRDHGIARALDVKGLWCAEGHAQARVVALEDPAPTPHPTFDVIDTTTGAVSQLDGKPMVTPDAIFTVRDRTVFEITGAVPALRWTAPDTIAGAVAFDHRLGFALADGRLVELDPATGDTTTVRASATIDAFTLGADATFWYVSGTRVYHGHDAIGTLTSGASHMWATHAGGCYILALDRSLWRAGAHDLERVAVFDKEPVVLGSRTVAAVRSGAVRFTYVDTGEQFVIPSRDAIAVNIFDSDRVFAIMHSRDHQYLDIYTDPVPADPSALRAWLATATNAVVEPGRDAVVWR